MLSIFFEIALFVGKKWYINKTSQGDALRFFIHVVANQKKMKGYPLGEIFIRKSRHTMPKQTEWGPFSLARYCMLRAKKGKTFLV